MSRYTNRPYFTFKVLLCWPDTNTKTNTTPRFTYIRMGPTNPHHTLGINVLLMIVSQFNTPYSAIHFLTASMLN